jgi:hypothetical protein
MATLSSRVFAELDLNTQAASASPALEKILKE